MTTLIEILTSGLSYDSSWAVYAEKIDGQFEPESQARFGQTVFENGGLLDDCEKFGNNDRIVDHIEREKEGYVEMDYDIDAIAQSLIEQYNETE